MKSGKLIHKIEIQEAIDVRDEFCECGCGLKPKPGNRYINGHNFKGKKRPDISGKNNGMFCKKRPEISGNRNPNKCPEARARIRERMKGNNFNLGRKNPKHSEWMKNNSPSKHPEVAAQISKSTTGQRRPGIRGENNPAWNGGSSFFPYSPEFTDELKQFIKDRDDHECQNPYCDHKTKRLNVHHINYNKQNCSQFNLITLCMVCNVKANINRMEWQRLYKKIIWSKY